MNEYWKNLISPWRSSPMGVNLAFSATPAQPVDEPWRASWPMTIGQTPPMPSAPVLPTPPKGGLFSSLDASTGGGLFGRLAPPLGHLDAGKYGGAAPLPAHQGEMPILGNDDFLSRVPRAANWDMTPSRAPVGSAESPPELSSQSRSSAPARNPDRGQWTSSSGELRGVPEILSDVTPDNYWIPGADYAAEHHIFPQAHYKRIPRETRKVFKGSTIGELFLSLDGRRHEFDTFHRKYNEATGELLGRFMKEHNIIEPEQLTPDHARAVLKAVAESEDPRIRYYLEFIRRLRMFYRLRTGRGNE